MVYFQAVGILEFLDHWDFRRERLVSGKVKCVVHGLSLRSVNLYNPDNLSAVSPGKCPTSVMSTSLPGLLWVPDTQEHRTHITQAYSFS